MPECVADNCERPAECREMCESCYNRWRYSAKAGRPISTAAASTPIRRRRAEVVEQWRFMRGSGYTDEDVAATLGMQRASLRVSLRRAGLTIKIARTGLWKEVA